MRAMAPRSLATMALVLAFSSVAEAQKAQPAPAPSAAALVEAKRLSDAFAQVAEKVSPSVVQIEVTVRNPNAAVVRFSRGLPSAEAPTSRGNGSGVVLTEDGAILTNNHVIEDALSISVRLHDGRVLPAKLLGRDPASDLAVVRIEAKGLVPASFADSKEARVGEWVVAIGAPFGLGHTVTTGVVSAKGRGSLGVNAVEDYLQTDASINPGNSGGPLVNLDGQVLGINTMIVGRGQGIGFAVPSNLARKVADQLVKSGKVVRAWIGVGVQDTSPELAEALQVEPGSGALVNSVMPNSPGARAQLRPGDIVASVDGKKVRDAQELIRELLSHDVGHTAFLEVIRSGKRYGTRTELTARPESNLPPIPAQVQTARGPGLGLTVRDLSAEAAQGLGLLAKPVAQVTQVSPGSSAERAGVKPGDVIVEADGVSQPTSAQVVAAAEDGKMLLRLKRQNSSFYAAVKK